jgi:hypothetical protein
MTVLESIVRDLHELPPPKLVEVAAYIHGLTPKNRDRRRTALFETAGSLSGIEGEEFELGVKAESDRMD